MHPAIRIVCFLVFGAALAMGGYAVHGAAIAALALGYVLARIGEMGPSWQVVRRMRWLFISILIVYFWYTPGEPVLPGLGGWSPSLEGMRAGMLRMLTLVLLALGVSLLLQATPRPVLVAALLWLLAPLRVVGFPHERFAVRLLLTMENVTLVQALYSGLGAQNAPGKWTDRLGAPFMALFQRVLGHAGEASIEMIAVPRLPVPPWYQWGYPAALLAGFYAVNGVMAR